MNIVIVGDGKVGFALTDQLAREGHDVTVIDSNKLVLQEAQSSLDINVVHGNGATLKIQKMANVPSSDLLIAATSADEINLLCCIMAKKLGCRHTIARVRNPEYFQQLYLMKEELGLSMMINPERTAASEIFRLLQFPSFLKRDSFAKGRVEIVELALRPGSPLIGMKLSQFHQRGKVKVLVCAVERGQQVFIPDGSFQLEEGDKLSLTASSGDLARMLRDLEITQKKVKDAMIIGGSRIAIYLAEELLRAGVSVKLIEIDEARCQLLADVLPKATVIHADGSSRSVLDSEGLARTDALVTLTDMDEENLIISMYANYRGTCKVITKIDRTDFTEALADKGIDCIVSPKELCCNDIVRYVRAMGNPKGESVHALHRIVGDRVEALEFHANEKFSRRGQKLADLKTRPNTLIACINRGGKVIFPSGRDCIQAGDIVVVVALSDQVLDDLEDVFLGER